VLPAVANEGRGAHHRAQVVETETETRDAVRRAADAAYRCTLWFIAAGGTTRRTTGSISSLRRSGFCTCALGRSLVAVKLGAHTG